MPDYQGNQLLRNEIIGLVADTDTVIAPGNMRRHAFIVSAPPTSRITLRFGGRSVLDQGLTIYPGTLPLRIDEGWVGSALKEEIHAIGLPPGQSVYFLDIFHS